MKDQLPNILLSQLSKSINSHLHSNNPECYDGYLDDWRLFNIASEGNELVLDFEKDKKHRRMVLKVESFSSI